MPNIIPKRNTWFTILGCLTAIVFALLFWHKALDVKSREMLFLIPAIILLAAFLYSCYRWLITLKEDVYEYFSGRMWLVIITTVILFAWLAGWGSQFVADKEDHIEYIKK